jgi:hypothetical protein
MKAKIYSIMMALCCVTVAKAIEEELIETLAAPPYSHTDIRSVLENTNFWAWVKASAARSRMAASTDPEDGDALLTVWKKNARGLANAKKVKDSRPVAKTPIVKPRHDAVALDWAIAKGMPVKQEEGQWLVNYGNGYEGPSLRAQREYDDRKFNAQREANGGTMNGPRIQALNDSAHASYIKLKEIEAEKYKYRARNPSGENESIRSEMNFRMEELKQRQNRMSRGIPY